VSHAAVEPEDQTSDPLVDRAIRLFQFLARGQQLKNPPARTLDSYSVVWLNALPLHPAVQTIREDPGIEDALLTVDRVPLVALPEPDPTLATRLRGARDEPAQPPELEPLPAPVEVDPLAAPYQQFLDLWYVWADKERVDRPARQLYANLFSLYNVATGSPEELELVVGVGCLAWDPVRRHMFTAPIAIVFDDSTGRITVKRAESFETLTVELDMLDPGLTTSEHIDDVRIAAEQIETHPLHREQVGALVRRLVNTLDPDGEYVPDSGAPAFSDHATAAFAPAIIMRKRSQQGLVQIFTTIQRQIAETGHVPEGIAPLIDPDFRPAVAGDRSDGALVRVDDDDFLPLPVNDVQLRILRNVDANAQTLVQGPPGTGKTHTAAALLAHLLAQGKRVLVTAHTDRALKEVRAKLPSAIRPLSVAVVGASREEMADLKVSIEHIVSVAAEHDADAASQTIQSCLATIEELRQTRANLYRDLRDGRENELREFEHAGYRGTLGAIARQHFGEADAFGWIGELVSVPEDAPPPLDDSDVTEWHHALIDPALAGDLPEANQRLVDLSMIATPKQLAGLLAAAAATGATSAGMDHLKNHPAFGALHRLQPDQRADLQRRLHALADTADDLSRRREAWLNDALADVRLGRAGIWNSRAQNIAAMIASAERPVQWLDPRVDIRIAPGADLGLLVNFAQQVSAELATGTKLKIEPDGTPKIGALTPKPVKAAQPLFAAVRVNGLPPTTPQQLDIFHAWADAMTTLDALDRAWPDNVQVPAEDTLHERLQWHKTEHEQLGRVLQLGIHLDAAAQWLAGLGLPRPDWTDLDSVREYASVVDAVGADDKVAASQAPLARLHSVLTAEAQWVDRAPCVQQLLDATISRDPNAYAAAFDRLSRLWDVRAQVARRDEIALLLPPGIRAAVESGAADPLWTSRLALFGRAWAWASTGSWLLARTSSDVNALQAEITRTEEGIRKQVENLAATRAWGHAVSADRLTGRARANLTQYAQLVRTLGKGTGKYAEKQRADIRQALDRCRPSVPVWIMPVYRIAEQFQVQPDMFDVVIVDEASQAGLEATFLQYLAPKMVVIGDDKQVSPAAVGVDQQQLRDLARQYLPDDGFRSTWADPTRSLFDEAKMRYSGMLTLTEHRRSVPEIIGFSNRIAYEPDGIRLIPVRQYGADRLEPIKAIYLPGAVTRGTTSKTNQAEIGAIVDQIEKCIADPQYDGLTFGVISLLGTAQAKAIERALLERVPASEWQARDLRCGDSTDFQGSERNVMFLSMVTAPEPGARVMPLTRGQFVQRFNVAGSRAKDQMWVFHSVDLAELDNTEDMRFALLDYCYGVMRGTSSSVDLGGQTAAVSPDVLVRPFDSLFEQRVFNQLVSHGYSVIPQYPTEGYRIDLVVVGAKARLAIECDGDTWHGPEAYDHDLARQRDLERCGWEFFRIRETEFYVDRASVLDQLWQTLGELAIHPAGWVPPISEPAAALADAADAPAVSEPALAAPAVSAVSAVSAPSAAALAVPSLAEPSLASGLTPYVSFSGQLAPPHGVSTDELVAGIVSILDAEGPMLGHRLYLQYVRASGGRRTGTLINEALESALGAAAQQGVVAVDNPLGDAAARQQTYRLPHQPSVRVRALGTRNFEEIPPEELATLIALAADSIGWDNEETLFRTTLDMLGLKRLTTGVMERLQTVLPLARGPEPVPVTAMFTDDAVDQSTVDDWVSAASAPIASTRDEPIAAAGTVYGTPRPAPQDDDIAASPQ
jgi:very-short-patch-repair endonuclease